MEFINVKQLSCLKSWKLEQVKRQKDKVKRQKDKVKRQKDKVKRTWNLNVIIKTDYWMKENELTQRLFKFAVRTIRFLKTLRDSPEVKVIRYQLIKSSTSSGANYEEAQAGSSKADFTNKVRISLKEMRESNYWLRLIKEVVNKAYDNMELDWLINESTELKKILGTIVLKSSKNK